MVSATRETVSRFGGGAIDAGTEAEEMPLIGVDDNGDSDDADDLASASVVVAALEGTTRAIFAVLSPPRANTAAAEVIK